MLPVSQPARMRRRGSWASVPAAFAAGTRTSVFVRVRCHSAAGGQGNLAAVLPFSPPPARLPAARPHRRQRWLQCCWLEEPAYFCTTASMRHRCVRCATCVVLAAGLSLAGIVEKVEYCASSGFQQLVCAQGVGCATPPTAVVSRLLQVARQEGPKLGSASEEAPQVQLARRAELLEHAAQRQQATLATAQSLAAEVGAGATDLPAISQPQQRMASCRLHFVVVQ